MNDHLTGKLVRAALRDGSQQPGSDIRIGVDQILIEDATGVMTCLQFEALGVDRIGVPFAIMYVDHNVLQIDEKNFDDHQYLQQFSARYGLHHSRPGNGISHYLHVERYARPGAVLVGADSHTTTSGAVGMLALGAGGLDVALAMAGEGFAFVMPRVVRVELRGALAPWVAAKDVVLELLRRYGVRGGAGCVFEFAGPGVATLSVTQRATICNMLVETGATTALFPSDARTRAWLIAQQRESDWMPLAADDDAQYDDAIVIELDALEPLVAQPSSPGNVTPVREVAGIPVAQVCIGSSVNSSYEDLAVVAATLRDRLVAESVECTVTPGSRQVLTTIARTGVYLDLVSAGTRMLEPVCGPCVGIGQAPPAGRASVRTFNRNFPGRSGTALDQVYLVSPETAAATARTGVLTDPRTLGGMPEWTPAPTHLPIDDRHVIPPLPPETARMIVVERGPNIVPAPPTRPLEDQLAASVAIVVGDDVSTGDMAPDGALAMAIWANIAECAKLMFRRFDTQFYERAISMDRPCIVAGENYGQGSSRENAAIIPVYLGVPFIAARSFATTHRRNLIAQGVVPLIIDEATYARATIGATWSIAGLPAALGASASSVGVTIADATGETHVNATLNVTPDERATLLAGGSLRAFHRRQLANVR